MLDWRELVDAESWLSRSSLRDAERDDEVEADALTLRGWSTRAARCGGAPVPRDEAGRLARGGAIGAAVEEDAVGNGRVDALAARGWRAGA